MWGECAIGYDYVYFQLIGQGNVMRERTEIENVSDDYLKTLEEVKEQYQQYVEVSELYTLPIQKGEDPVQYEPPSPEHPLTTNRISIK